MHFFNVLEKNGAAAAMNFKKPAAAAAAPLLATAAAARQRHDGHLCIEHAEDVCIFLFSAYKIVKIH